MKKLAITLSSIILLTAFGNIEGEEEIFEQAPNLWRDINEINNNIKELHGKIEVIEHNIKVNRERLDALENNYSKISESKNSSKSDNASLYKSIEKEKKEYDLALAALKDGNYKLSYERFLTFIKSYPLSDKLSNAYFWCGESCFRQKDFNNSGIYFLNGYKKFPRGNKASESLLKLSLSLIELDKKDEACETLNKLVNEFKDISLSLKKRIDDTCFKINCSIKRK